MAVTIPFNRDFNPCYGIAERIAPGLRRVTAPNGGPFTFRGTGTYIVGEGKVAVIDPGPLIDEHVAALLEATKGETISHIVITHTHLDHSPAAAPLKAATGAATWGFGPHGAGKIARGVSVEAGGDMDFRPDVVIGDGAVIEGDAWSLEAVHTPGHTSNHLAFAWTGTGVLFPGDLVMGWSTSVISPPDGDMTDYMKSLDKLLARDDREYWPTHGPAIQDPKPFVEAFIAHRRDREDQALEAVASGLATIGEMVPRIYADVQPAVHGAAARSLLATLLHLHAQGRVTSDGEPGIDARFSVSD